MQRMSSDYWKRDAPISVRCLVARSPSTPLRRVLDRTAGDPVGDVRTSWAQALCLGLYLSEGYNLSMDALDALRTLAEVTAGQWGLVTTAQAAGRGVSRLYLSRLAEDGQLERVGRGGYRAAAVPADRFEPLKAAWLSITPELTAEQRLRQLVPDAVVSGPAAAHLHGLGDLVPEPYEFTVPVRRQTQRLELKLRVRRLPAESVTLRDGLPVTTVEQTVADLVEARIDLSLVAGVLADAPGLDRTLLADLLTPLAARNRFPSGEAFLNRLDALARLVRKEA